jgi:hypothetical protein
MNKDLSTNVINVNTVSKNPGPSEYEIKPLINGNGKSHISKYRNNNAITMSSKFREKQGMIGSFF